MPKKRPSRFCSRKCRNADTARWNLRGGQLVRVFMHHRFSRSTARSAELYGLACRMASNWRQEDKAAGRDLPELQDLLESRVSRGSRK